MRKVLLGLLIALCILFYDEEDKNIPWDLLLRRTED